MTRFFAALLLLAACTPAPAVPAEAHVLLGDWTLVQTGWESPPAGSRHAVRFSDTGIARYIDAGYGEKELQFRYLDWQLVLPDLNQGRTDARLCMRFKTELDYLCSPFVVRGDTLWANMPGTEQGKWRRYSSPG